MELVDTHCHIDTPAFAADRPQVLRRARAAGVSDLVVPGIRARDWPGLLDLCAREPGLHATLGLHPVALNHHRDADLDTLDKLLGALPVIAVGEIGLDHYVPDLDRARQRALLDAQLDLAVNHRLPVILHARKSHDEVLAALRRARVRGGIAHAFNGSLQQARQYQDLGFRLGFGGTLTYEGSHRIHRLARALPLEAMVLETDAPDMPVAAHRGERNSPEYLSDCLHALARIRGEDPEEIARQTTRNARETLALD